LPKNIVDELTPRDLPGLLTPFRETERPEAAYVIVKNEVAKRLLSAWPSNIGSWRVPKKEPPPGLESGAATREVWEWIWRGMILSEKFIRWICQVTGADQVTAMREYELLVANRLIYPDGTTHAMASSVVRAELMERYESVMLRGRRTPSGQTEESRAGDRDDRSHQVDSGST
jgi:hypothetical protein